jgi:hypothetical protein
MFWLSISRLKAIVPELPDGYGHFKIHALALQKKKKLQVTWVSWLWQKKKSSVNTH